MKIIIFNIYKKMLKIEIDYRETGLLDYFKDHPKSEIKKIDINHFLVTLIIYTSSIGTSWWPETKVVFTLAISSMTS